MNIVLINGTEVRGCTYHIKEFFLDELRDGNNLKEFYLPKDCPHFCCGCKTCFFKNENGCPHAEYTVPLWNDIIHADLLVFAYPVYVLRAPGQVKALYVKIKKTGKSVKHHLFFAICKMLHQKIIKTENPMSVDSRYWLDKKWIKR
jgi:hypothetical protein